MARCHSVPMRVLPLFLLSLFAAAAFAQEQTEPCPPRYSYCGYSGPAQWLNLPIEKNDCGGPTQSPINLGTPRPTLGEPITVKYKAGDATIWNSGYDTRVIPNGDAGWIKIGNDGKEYPLVNFHFHTPSEHHIAGAASPAEIHIVHKRVEGEKTYYAVIGVMLTAGETYSALAPVFAKLPTRACQKVDKELINFNELLPETLVSYYTYVGSLTTPPCTEGVNWYVLDAARTILGRDLARLSALGENARPLQRNTKPIPVTYVIAK